ncbi:hypothetical protein, partial [Kitasatospora sp. NPDC056531]|uniref:hypothetical protein n=1 Tax=Kitasatospora sp. NPDC056531 TaxID=3345856 RepID=UPI0036C69523
VTPGRFARLDRIGLGIDLPPLDEGAAEALFAEVCGGEPTERQRELAAGAGRTVAAGPCRRP